MTSKKKISAWLDPITFDKLNRLLDINDCTISDMVNIAIVALNDKEQIVHGSGYFYELRRQLKQKNMTLNRWCEIHAIQRPRLYYILNAADAGKTVCGFGNQKNKWRDKQDDRLFKTHTAWIAHCLKEDFGIEL